MAEKQKQASAPGSPAKPAKKATPAKKETKPRFLLSTSPYLAEEDNVPRIMWSVCLALLPAIFSACYYFGLPSLVLILGCGVAAVATEIIANKLRGRGLSVGDGSAFLTGILLALTLPPSFPVWMGALGAVFAIAVGKQLFGGLGQNIFNPALLGRAFLQASFIVPMTTWSVPRPLTLDAITSATPLGSVKFDPQYILDSTLYIDMFTGRIGGCLGETSALAALLGGLLLVLFQYSDWRIPTGFLGTVFVLGGAFWIFNPAYPDPLFHLLSGGLLFGAFFMATDMVTSPVTPLGTWIFAIGAGVLLIFIRLFGALPEGVMYSILLMNALTPLINRYTRPRYFGEQAR